MVNKSLSGAGLKVLAIGGEDVRMRIPLLQALRSRGFEVAALGSEDALPFKKEKIPYFYYPLHRGFNPFKTVHSNDCLKALLKKHRPDIIHAFDTKPAIFAPIVAFDVGIKVRIRTITGMGYLYSETNPLTLVLRPFYERLQRKASGLSSRTIFQNPDDQNFFLTHRMVTKRSSELVMSSGIDIETFQASLPSEQACHQWRAQLGIKQSDFVVSLVCRVLKNKGVLEFFKAAKTLKSKHSNLKFILVGPRLTEGSQAISESMLNRSKREVCYLGPQKNIAQVLGASDLFVLPSYYREGVPRVLLEAGAARLPIVTTNTPGCKEVVRPGYNGLLVSPRNFLDLSSAVERVYKLSQEERMSWGKNSETHIKENFSLSFVADQYANIYRECAAQAENS